MEMDNNKICNEPFMKTIISLVFHEPSLLLEIVISVAPKVCLIEDATNDA